MPDPLSLVVFSLDEQRYALRLASVERTVRMVEITSLPRAPEIVLGVIDAQGEIMPVLDIRRRFRLPERQPGIADQLIMARTARRSVALVADAVVDVVTLPVDELVAPASILPQLDYVAGVARLDDGMVFIHDLDAFLSLEEEQALATALTANG
ncbi:MAG TPA: chemotaxis protein CheW [Desulfuromonadaceae bacterium]